MKTTKNLMALLFVAIMLQPFLFKAQGQVVSSAKTANTRDERKAAIWNPVKLSEKEGNVRNGVEFYNQKNICGSQKVAFLKLVNKNNYTVKVSYQLTPDSPTVNVTVQASASLEGSCSSTDGNLAKLVVNPPSGTAERTDTEKQKMKEFLYSHIVVTQVQ